MRPLLRASTYLWLAVVPVGCGPTSAGLGANASAADGVAEAAAADAATATTDAADPTITLASDPSGIVSTSFVLRLRQASSSGRKLCVDVRDQSRNNGARVQLWTCAGSDNQAFSKKGDMLQIYGNKCLNVVDGKNVTSRPAVAQPRALRRA